ncbi:MAG: ATP-binding cassette domain-containing protein [Pseudomonadales bacterium]|nr:ATP-binding cassette domain-containing protein [Pseudomonadales bacterium]
MITLNEISLQRSGKSLFETTSLRIHSGQRFALIGQNGCGKSTLFQVLLGNMQTDAGDVDIPKDLRIAHMAQEVEAIERNARDYVIDGFHQLRRLQEQLKVAEAKDDNNALAHIHADMDALDAYTVDYRAEQILAGLGFKTEDFDKRVAEFSGGWRIRLNLAQTLICPSDLLLLDEPTNHLDMEAIQWLEQWLKQYQGSLLLISHDRDFIDAAVDHIAHIEDCKINIYNGSYSDFERQRAEKLEQQQSIHIKQQARAKDLQRFIDRFRAQATKAKQAQSRIKALERMQMVGAVREKSPYQFNIPHADKTGSPLVNWFKVDVGYENNITLKNCKLSISPGLRVGLLGSNGCGKSTLIKTIVGDLAPQAGEVVTSEHLKIGYFAQHQLEALDVNASPILHLQRLTPKATEQSIRDFLGSFKIFGDMATESIENFSGGEKARLALAVLAWQKPNLLLMDEPTNHLDIEMREALAEALQKFEGAVILVSHDRYLLRNCVDEFWLLENQHLSEFDGDISDYYAYRNEQIANTSNSDKKTAVVGEVAVDKKQQRQQAAQKRSLLAPITNKIKNIEKKMAKAELELTNVRDQLADSSIYDGENKKQLQSLLADESSFQTDMEELEMQWFELQEQLNEIEAG